MAKTKLGFTKAQSRLFLISSLLVFSVVIGVYTGIQSLSVITPIESVLSPFYTQRASYKVYDEFSNDLLYEFNPGDDADIIFDDLGRYPGIKVYVSQPFLTDNMGNEVTYNEDEVLYNPNGVYEEYEFKDESGEFIFAQAFTLGYDVGVKTVANIQINKFDYYLDPMLPDVYKKAFQITFPSCHPMAGETMNGNKYPYGVLYASVDDSLYGWSNGQATTWHINEVKFPDALVPNPTIVDTGFWYPTDDDFPDTCINPYTKINRNGQDISVLDDPTLDLGDWENYLSNWYGNRKVKVKPNVTFQVIDDILNYDYFVPVLDQGVETGDKFQIYSKDTKIGIINVRSADNKKQEGIVQNDFIRENYQVSNDFENNPVQEDSESISTSLTGSDQTGEKGVYFKYDRDFTYDLQFNLDILSDTYLQTNTTYQGFSLEDFQLPKIAWAVPTMYLQPFTQVKMVDFEFLAAGVTHFGCCDLYPSLTKIGPQKVTNVPYGMIIQNTFGIARILIDVVVISRNEVDYIPLGGSSIKVEDLADYGISDFGLTPNNFGIYATGGTANPFTTETLTFWIIIIIAIVAVIIVLTVLGLNVFTKIRGGGGGGGPTQIFLGGFGGKGKKSKKGGVQFIGG